MLPQMQFKFFNTGLICSFWLVLTAGDVLAQLDWSQDAVVFGTNAAEFSPQIVPIPNGQFRAFCLTDSQRIRTRLSSLRGEAWQAFADLHSDENLTQFWVAADSQYTFIFSSDGHLRRISHSESNWEDNWGIAVLPSQTTILKARLFVDSDFDQDESYLHGLVLYRNSQNATLLDYFLSEDQAFSLSHLGTIDSAFAIQDSNASVSGAYTWTGDAERLWAAMSFDRPGSTGPQVALYYSDDIGQSWSSRITPDTSSYSQVAPDISGFEETLVLTYQRRNSSSIANDIYSTYSPDNGVSWSQPLQLTNHAFDDVKPSVVISDEIIGLFYGRLQVQLQTGQIYTRTASLDEPWNWQPETEVCGNDDFNVDDGFHATRDQEGFAAVWTGRIVGEDGDVFFDASWRGLSVIGEQPESPSEVQLSPSSMHGMIEYRLPNTMPVKLQMYDILGRLVAEAALSGPRGVWAVPEQIASGTYLLSAGDSSPILIQIAH